MTIVGNRLYYTSNKTLPNVMLLVYNQLCGVLFEIEILSFFVLSHSFSVKLSTRHYFCLNGITIFPEKYVG